MKVLLVVKLALIGLILGGICGFLLGLSVGEFGGILGMYLGASVGYFTAAIVAIGHPRVSVGAAAFIAGAFAPILCISFVLDTGSVTRIVPVSVLFGAISTVLMPFAAPLFTGGPDATPIGRAVEDTLEKLYANPLGELTRFALTVVMICVPLGVAVFDHHFRWW